MSGIEWVSGQDLTGCGEFAVWPGWPNRRAQRDEPSPDPDQLVLRGILGDTGLDLADLRRAAGSRMLRWALIEAIQHVPAGHPLRQRKDDIIARRATQARNIAKVAAVRQLLTWVFYAMRDGQAPRPGRRRGAGRVSRPGRGSA